MSTVTTIAQLLITLLFLFVGGGKILGAGPTKQEFMELGYPQWVRIFSGALELGGALLLLVGLFVPITTFFGAAILIIPLLLSIIPRLRLRQAAVLLPTTVLLLVGFIGWQQPLGLQLLMLPRQADAPEARVPSELIGSHPFGAFLESVQIDSDGTLYYTNLEGADFGAASLAEVMANAQGQIWQLKPGGEPTLYASTPVGTIAGVVEWREEGLYFSASGADTTGLWRVIPGTNETELLVPLPDNAFPNGTVQGPDGHFYIADSGLGLIWQLDVTEKTAVPWLTDPLLKQRPFVSLAPGANGIEYWNGSFYVAVSDKAHIVRIPVLADGTAGEPVVHATGVSGDDFAISSQGVLYVTTHLWNSVVQVNPDGSLILIAAEAEGMAGSTDAVLSADESILYVVTDGGLFEGRTDGLARVVALEVGETAVSSK